MTSFLFNPLQDPPAIKVGISACLLGYKVRYDGKTKSITELLKDAIIETQWSPICPEITLGVPRPPVQLVKTRHLNEIQAIGVEDAQLNVTDRLKVNSLHILNSQSLQAEQPDTDIVTQLERTALGNNKAQETPLKDGVDIWLLKARSPSCGSQSTPLYDDKGEQRALTDGIFAKSCRELAPLCGIFDEEAFSCRESQQIFYLTALITQDIKQTPDSALKEFIAHYKKQQLLPDNFCLIDKTQVCHELHKSLKKSGGGSLDLMMRI